ncbi:hypothetical protein OQA88_8245 [Cercophora sp. LCS_1]
MKLQLLATALGWASATALTIPSNFTLPAGNGKCKRSDYNTFASCLSNNAEAYFPGSTGFNTRAQRWSELEAPTASFGISVATEDDVSETIKFANKCGLRFLAYNGRHGSLTTLGAMDDGIAIFLHKLNSVSLGSNTATVGGGINSKALVDTLWAANRQIVSGTCECVSFLGPALGGGHGWLQGHYGLIGDQFVSMRVVTADGVARTVSANSNSDLFWAMKGAGANFGVVTSVTIKTYPRIHTNWAVETIMFTGDKVEQVYQAVNDHLLQNGTQPVGLIQWSYWFNIPGFDAPVIALYIIQEGVSAVSSAYTQPFHDIGPFSIEPASGSYRDISGWVGINLDAPPCQKAGFANPRFPIYLEKFNATAMGEVYDAFKTATLPSSPFHGSLFMFEGYSTQGVKSISASSSAFAFRGDNLLIAPLLQYTPDGPSLDAYAAQVGNNLREILRQGSGRQDLHTYVNYAYGNESPQQWYGFESWRQQRLLTLKNKYDPFRRFNLYAPAA